PNVPTCYVWGRKDPLVAYPHPLRSNDRLVHANHNAPLTVAAEVAEVALPFLATGLPSIQRLVGEEGILVQPGTASQDSRLVIKGAGPPITFEPERAYFEHSVAIPQFHLVLVSVLQSVVFTIFVTEHAPHLPANWPSMMPGLLFSNLSTYAPYILSVGIILI